VDHLVELARRLRRAAMEAQSLSRLVADPVGQLGDLVVDRATFGHQLTDLAVGVHDRGVVAPPEELADLG